MDDILEPIVVMILKFFQFVLGHLGILELIAVRILRLFQFVLGNLRKILELIAARILRFFQFLEISRILEDFDYPAPRRRKER